MNRQQRRAQKRIGLDPIVLQLDEARQTIGELVTSLNSLDKLLIEAKAEGAPEDENAIVIYQTIVRAQLALCGTSILLVSVIDKVREERAVKCSHDLSGT